MTITYRAGVHQAVGALTLRTTGAKVRREKDGVV